MLAGGCESSRSTGNSKIPIRRCSRAKGAGRPPVHPAEHTHEGRHEQHPNARCVYQDRQRHAETTTDTFAAINRRRPILER